MFSLDGYKAVTSGGGIVRRSDRGVLSVTGRDRATWLQGLLTNDVESLKPGEQQYAAYLTPQGRMITDMHVFAQADRLLLDVPLPLAATLRDRLDGLIFSEDAAVADESARVLVWTVIDPDRLTEVVGETLPDAHATRTEINMATFEVIRVERGEPRFLADMTDDTIPLEAGIEDRAISFTKGCYVGQEVIVRVTHRGGGRVAKRLVRWIAGAGEAVVPQPDARITSAGKDVGRVTSAVFSPRLDRVVGMGYVQRDFATGGTELAVMWNDAPIKATVQ